VDSEDDKEITWNEFSNKWVLFSQHHFVDTDMESLPTDIIFEIFSYLRCIDSGFCCLGIDNDFSVGELQQMCLVCKKLRKLSDAAPIWKTLFANSLNSGDHTIQCHSPIQDDYKTAYKTIVIENQLWKVRLNLEKCILLMKFSTAQSPKKLRLQVSG
jgi:hypothetical protein